jgi:hypothetical protein
MKSLVEYLEVYIICGNGILKFNSLIIRQKCVKVAKVLR